MASGAAAEAAAPAKKRFYQKLWFRVVATAGGASLVYQGVDHVVFHPPSDLELVNDLLLKKGCIRKECVVILGTGWGHVQARPSLLRNNL